MIPFRIIHNTDFYKSGLCPEPLDGNCQGSSGNIWRMPRTMLNDKNKLDKVLIPALKKSMV